MTAVYYKQDVMQLNTGLIIISYGQSIQIVYIVRCKWWEFCSRSWFSVFL